MYVSWENVPADQIGEGWVVRTVTLGRWDPAKGAVSNPFTVTHVAVERCSVPNCTAIVDVHPLEIEAAGPHEFT